MLRTIGRAQRRRRNTQGLYDFDTRPSSPIGPRKAFRIILRVVLWTAVSWFLLALLWAFLPFPGAECDDACAKSVLGGGWKLTRVYKSDAFHMGILDRWAFALDYKVSSSSHHPQELIISDINEALPLYNRDLKMVIDAESSEKIQVIARLGDTDGANLPWFPFTDSVLLFWWIHKETVKVDLEVRWSWASLPHQRQRFILAPADPVHHSTYEPLLSLESQKIGITSKIVNASVPQTSGSGSPSKTYLIRVAIIHVLAPTSILINDLSGPLLAHISDLVIVLFIIILYFFFILSIFFSLWRCLGGPSFERVVEKLQDRLERWKYRQGTSRWMSRRIESVQHGIESMMQNERLMWIIKICREGWHPEKEHEKADAEREETGNARKGSDNGGVKIRIRV
ncbi:hypothetical protein F5884DRAFT_790065 [Xylogone sp. PMI_703]|nr:hypothetical protein F5884DRAFT_790065 [Xylogone sp. PMI_703]